MPPYFVVQTRHVVAVTVTVAVVGTVAVTVTVAATVTVTVFKFNACTYHTVPQPPAHVALTNVPLPIVVILLFDSSLQMQSYVCS